MLENQDSRQVMLSQTKNCRTSVTSQSKTFIYMVVTRACCYIVFRLQMRLLQEVTTSTQNENCCQGIMIAGNENDIVEKLQGCWKNCILQLKLQSWQPQCSYMVANAFSTQTNELPIKEVKHKQTKFKQLHSCIFAIGIAYFNCLYLNTNQ